jgi:outer membrane protein assembly factor BamB
MPSPGPRRARRWLVAGAVLVLALGATAAILLLHSPHNVSHPNISFTPPTATTTVTTTPPRRKRALVDTFLWARYGYDLGRDRDFESGGSLRPPFRVGWRFGGNALLEFPPVIYGHTLYLIDDGATAKAVNTVTGKLRWMTHVGTLSACSPAIDQRRHLIVVVTLSDHGRSPGGGEAAALSMKTGHILWRHPLGPGSESSPTIWGGNVYFGDQGGTVFSVRARDGHVNWTYQASGAVKGGPALANGILYFGDYAGRAYAVRASNGRQVWAVSTAGSAFGFGSGNFYATPAVAFGRVYLGNTDGRVYSFAARTGQLAWATGTGAYVYASASVGDVPGLGPTVFVGSYDGHFYAFNAQSGGVRWSHYAGGRISGSSTIVDGVVYYSDLGSKSTTGLDARTGRVVFSYPDGAFTPVIADPQAVYMSGYNTLYQLLPKRSAKHRRAAARHRRRAHASRSRATRRGRARGKRNRRR